MKSGCDSLLSQNCVFLPLYGRAPCHHFYFYLDNGFSPSTSVGIIRRCCLTQTKNMPNPFFQEPPVNSLWVEKQLSSLQSSARTGCVYGSELNVHRPCTEANWQKVLSVSILKFCYSPQKGISASKLPLGKSAQPMHCWEDAMGWELFPTYLGMYVYRQLTPTGGQTAYLQDCCHCVAVPFRVLGHFSWKQLRARKYLCLSFWL